MRFKTGQAAALLFAVAALTGCARKEAAEGAGVWMNHSVPAGEPQFESSARGFDSEPGRNEEAPAPEISGLPEETGRKLVTTASMEIRLDDLEAGAAKLDALAQKYGAYASSVRVYDIVRRYSLKVPASRLKPFLDEAATLGKILDYSETTEDVTLRYVDLESRLRTRRELLKTYQSYLGKAKNIEEILSVESRIADLQAEIDEAGSRFRALNNVIDYSTVDIELLGPVASSTRGRPTVGERVKELFAGVSGYMSTLAVILLGLVVYGVPTALIAFALFWLLFGKIGALRRLFRLASGKKRKTDETKPTP
jgi:hypothetical protein